MQQKIPLANSEQMCYNIRNRREKVRVVEVKQSAVDVISVCSANGEIRPLRMQLVDEERQLLRANIESVVKCEEVRHVGAEAKIFLCRATVWGQKWLFELKYSIRSHNWTLTRRLH